MGQGFRLNDFEENTLQALVAALSHPGTSELAPLGLSLIQGAQDRRAQNVATRQEGISSLQQLAAQLAAQGADASAVTGLITGQAQELPGMNGPRGMERMGDLGQYVQSLYTEGPVSGLAPADYRAQFNDLGGLDEENRAAIGSMVAEGLQTGIPFKDLRERIRQGWIASGEPVETVESAVAEAERMYEAMTGTSLAEMRSSADMLRAMQSSGVYGDFGALESNPAVTQFLGDDENIKNYLKGDGDVTGLMGVLMGQGLQDQVPAGLPSDFQLPEATSASQIMFGASPTTVGGLPNPSNLPAYFATKLMDLFM